MRRQHPVCGAGEWSGWVGGWAGSWQLVWRDVVPMSGGCVREAG